MHMKIKFVPRKKRSCENTVTHRLTGEKASEDRGREMSAASTKAKEYQGLLVTTRRQKKSKGQILLEPPKDPNLANILILDFLSPEL